MADAPNFGTEFGWRKPCLRYIGPLLRTTCVAPVGRGDLAPPSWTHRPAPLPRRGRAPSRPAGKAPFHTKFPLVSGRLPHRVGADPCVRPETPPHGTRPRADTQVGPYRSSIYPPKPGGDGAPPLPVPPKPSINPGKTECLSENPQTNSPFSILNSQLSIVHGPFPPPASLP